MIMIPKKEQEPLINAVKEQINPNFPHWVLFKEGSYVIFTDDLPENNEELKTWAIEEMLESVNSLSTVYTYQEDIIATSSPKGWIVPAVLRGIYTFVQLSDFNYPSPSDLAIWVKGRNKLIQDSKEMEIIHINCPMQNNCCQAQEQ